MIDPQNLRRSLCSTFCSAIHVEPTPSGYAVSSAFTDRSGDRLSFYLSEDADGYLFEDDGEYLSRLVGLGIEIEAGTRGKLLSVILQNAGAEWDRDTFEIRTGAIKASEIAERAVDFLSALIRVRDLELMTREVVRSTFREDVLSALSARFSSLANIHENEPIDTAFADFPSDIVIRPTAGKSAAIYLVANNEHLVEAQLLQTEAEKLGRDDFSVVALIEDLSLPTISRRKFQRAQNRSLTMPIFRGDEAAALTLIERRLELGKA